MLGVQLPWCRDLKQHAMGKQGPFTNRKKQLSCIYPNSQISQEEKTRTTICSKSHGELLKTTAKWVCIRRTCPAHGNPAYIGEVEIWGFRPAAITSRLSIAWGSSLWSTEPRFSHSRLFCQSLVWLRVVAQLKPVKQDKSWLCQASTLQSTAEMMIAEDSAHTAGIHTKR